MPRGGARPGSGPKRKSLLARVFPGIDLSRYRDTLPTDLAAIHAYLMTWPDKAWRKDVVGGICGSCGGWKTLKAVTCNGCRPNRGGSRRGSGAKKKDGVPRRDNGRTRWVDPCPDCGTLKTKKSARCQGCSGAARVKKRTCCYCGAEHTLRGRRTCSDACFKASQEAHWARLKRPDTLNMIRRRERRRKASEKRRLSGCASGRKQQGRWRLICERDSWKCWVCGGLIDSALSPPNRLAGTVDHVVPLSHGGSDDDSNVKAAHFTCNVRRFKTSAQLAIPQGVSAYGI